MRHLILCRMGAVVGQQTARKGAGSLAAYYSYDQVGRMTNLMDAMYQNTGFSYSDVGNLTKKTYADGSFYSYLYNSRG